ncbi:hypothetical protein [Marinilactibacillus psychrotolerans]|nr:hypothetical protein [Marinilactibacillus psychrotolerans]
MTEIYTELLNTLQQQTATIELLVEKLQEKENLINELLKGS